MSVVPTGLQYFANAPFFTDGSQTDALTLADGRILNLFLDFRLGAGFQFEFVVQGVAIDPVTQVREEVFAIVRDNTQVFLDAPKATQLSDGRVAVVWGEPQTTMISAPNDLTVQIFNGDWSVSVPATTIVEDAHNPNEPLDNYDIEAQSGGGFALSWVTYRESGLLPPDSYERTMLSRFDENADQIGTSVTINGTAQAAAFAPKIMDLNSGDVIVAWFEAEVDETTLSFNGINLQRFDAAGAPLGSAFNAPDPPADGTGLVNTFLFDTAPLIDGGFVLVWIRLTLTDTDDFRTTFAQRYSASGVEIGDPIEINQLTSGTNATISVAGLQGGGFVVAYSDENASGPDTDGSAINVTVVDTAGLIDSQDVLVNSTYPGDQVAPWVTATREGGFVVTWGEDDERDVFARTFDVSAFSTLPTAGDDTLTGSDNADVLSALSGNDILLGLDGDDTLSGGAGDDILNGGAGNDTVTYADAGGRVAVFLARSAGDLGSGQGVDTFFSIENVIGSNFDDRLVGDNADNVLSGGAGADVLIGLAGNDTLNGGDGADDLTGSGGNDELNGGFGADILNGLGGADVLNGGGGDDDIFAGLGVDVVNGNAGDDLIFGNFGQDTLRGGLDDDDIRAGGSADFVEGGDGKDKLVGGNGKDLLYGGADNDVLTGGNGDGLGDDLRDVFVFKSAANGGGGFDRIRDFEDTVDKLDLTDSGYTSFAEVLADATNKGANLEIDFDFGGILVIENFQVAEFTAGDVLGLL
ncbi:MAG: calcium-binding protein [Aliishimia sp.]